MAKESLRKSGQVLPIITAVLVVLFTLANAAANMLPTHRLSRVQLRHAEEQDLIAARRVRIIERLVRGDGCVPVIAHELARDLVFDGRSARGYADDYEKRCGEDPVVRHWGDAHVRPWKS
jgi:hypothetical protein